MYFVGVVDCGVVFCHCHPEVGADGSAVGDVTFGGYEGVYVGSERRANVDCDPFSRHDVGDRT
jgi:hypothetical protein